MNLAEGLAREIRRVAELRCFYASLDDVPDIKDRPRIIVEPAMTMMDLALEEACVASGTGDIGRMMTAHNELKGFEK